MDGNHYFVARTPIDAAHFVVQSESSDSADDPGTENAYGEASARVMSYDYGGSNSVRTMTEDYDSVRGSTETFGTSNGINPLSWLWEKKTNWMGGVRSGTCNVAIRLLCCVLGVSTAAKSGAKMSKSVWTWAVVAAVTVGGVSMNRAGLPDMACFDSSDSEDGDADDVQADNRVDYFMG